MNWRQESQFFNDDDDLNELFGQIGNGQETLDDFF